jgi:hypothetical protein
MIKRGLTLLTCPAALLLIFAGTRPVASMPAQAAGSAASVAAAVDSVHVEIEDTLFHPINGVILRVKRMHGRLVGEPGKVISLDDPNSFRVEIDEGVTVLTAANLSALLNSYLLPRAHSPIEHLDVSFDGQQVVVKGRIHELVSLPFEGRGGLTATPDGNLRLHLDEFRVAGVLSKHLLETLGIRLDSVARSQVNRSYRVDGDDFIAPLVALFPPPLVSGHLTGVHIEGQNMVQVLGVPFPDEQPGREAVAEIPKGLNAPANYIYFQGGRMKFGKVTMEDVDLKLVDLKPGNPFDFSLHHYQEQIQAGYVKVMPTLGLVVYTADYGDVRRGKQ